MKMLLAFFISLQLVTNFSFFEEVVRIPVLIEHYYNHAERESGDFSFLDFIQTHYFSTANHHESDHASLPFSHSCDAGHVHVSPAFTLPEFLNELTSPLVAIEHVIQYKQCITTHNLDSIFQPPKTAV